MAVQAKFYVAETTKFSNEWGKVVLRPVTRGEANKDWAAATPSGTIEMSITNPPALKWFEDRIGKECAITFEEYEHSEG